jgi:hypothetical protein
VSFAAITLCVASQRVFIVYFIIDAVRKLLDTFSYVRGTFCLHLQGEVKMEAASSETSVSYHNTTWHQSPKNFDLYIYGMITNDMSDYKNLLVRIAHIICNHPT